MAATSTVHGTFKSTQGIARASITVVFKPIDTPKSSGNDLITSTQLSYTTDVNGQVGISPTITLVTGYYTVIVDGRDAFTIFVPDDGGSYDLKDIAVNINDGNILTSSATNPSNVLSAFEESSSIGFTRSGDPYAERTRFLVIGGTQNQAASLGMYGLFTIASIDEVVMLGMNSPLGDNIDLDANTGYFISRYIFPYTGAYPSPDPLAENHAWYVLGDVDWTPGNVTAITNYFNLPGNERYYTKSISDDVGIFVLSTSNDEPDGNTYNSTQGAWLQAALAASTKRWKIVFAAHAPFASVTGYSASWMENWPFAAWGAHAVVATGANIFEHITLEGNIPLFVVGTNRESSADMATLGTPVSGSVFRYNDEPGLFYIDANAYSLQFWFASKSGLMPYAYELVGAGQNKIQAYVRAGEGMFLDETGLRMDIGFAEGQALGANDNYVALKTGRIIRFNTLPTTEEVRQNPWWKECWWQVGTDPVVVWAWHPTENTPYILFVTSQGLTPYHAPPRTQLALPEITPWPIPDEVSLVHINSPDSGVTLYYSINGAAFVEVPNYPTADTVYAPGDGRPFLVAAYAVKAGYIDSEITYANFTSVRAIRI